MGACLEASIEWSYSAISQPTKKFDALSTRRFIAGIGACLQASIEWSYSAISQPTKKFAALSRRRFSAESGYQT